MLLVCFVGYVLNAERPQFRGRFLTFQLQPAQVEQELIESSSYTTQIVSWLVIENLPQA